MGGISSIEGGSVSFIGSWVGVGERILFIDGME